MSIPAHDFNYEEFHAFVMLYAANADGEINEKEEVYAIAGLKKKKYAEVKKIFEQCDDNQALQIILSYREKYLSTPEDRDRILNDMATIYEADGVFRTIERGVHRLFERLLKTPIS